ncbi:MAG: tetratricopeptide repeat protein [Balneolaceae bacterium]
MTNKEIIIQIDNYINGKLDTREIDLLWVKFLENPDWFEWFETELHLRYLVNKNKKSSIHPLDPPVRQASPIRKYKNWMMAAAAVVIISFGLQFLFFAEGDLAGELAFEQISRSELIGADILRSDSQQTDPLDISINEALAAALENDIDMAIEKFRAILTQSPDTQQRARTEMNLGILLYNQADYENARTHFEAVTQINTLSKFFEEKAWWFLGNTFLNLQQLDDARDAVFNAYSLDGRYKKPALALLKRLDMELGNVLPGDEQVNAE